MFEALNFRLESASEGRPGRREARTIVKLVWKIAVPVEITSRAVSDSDVTVQADNPFDSEEQALVVCTVAASAEAGPLASRLLLPVVAASGASASLASNNLPVKAAPESAGHLAD